MTDSTLDELLNDLLVEIHRSLVQYVHEAWPWTHAGDEQVQRTIKEVACQQQDDARGLFQFLLERGNRPDLGTYPADFTSLHFVSLDFLYPLVVQGQKQLVTDLQAALAKVPEGARGHQLLQSILTSSEAGLKMLESVTPVQPASLA